MRDRLLASASRIAVAAVLIVAVPVLAIFVLASWLIERAVVADYARQVAAALGAGGPVALDDRLALLAATLDTGTVTVREASGAVIAKVGSDTPALSFIGRASTATGLDVTAQMPADPFIVPVGAGLLAIALLGALAWLMAQRLGAREVTALTTGMTDLVAAAEQVGSGGQPETIRPTGVPEIDQVQAILVTAAERAAARVRLEQRIVHEVAHNLRSPLTALSLLLDEMATYPTDPETVQAEARRALRQVSRLRTAIDDVVVAHRGLGVALAEPVELATVIAAQVGSWQRVLALTERRLVTEVERGLVAWCPSRPVEQALSALLDNAVHHGAGEIRVVAGQRGAWVVVDVVDGGGSIPEDLEVFLPGVSTDGGRGLGCASARQLIESAGGRLELHRRRPTTFRILLPQVGVDGRKRGGRAGNATGSVAGPIEGSVAGPIDESVAAPAAGPSAVGLDTNGQAVPAPLATLRG